VQHCVNGDTFSQLEGSNFDPYRIETLESTAKNLAQLIWSMDDPSCQIWWQSM